MRNKQKFQIRHSSPTKTVETENPVQIQVENEPEKSETFSE